QGYLACPVPPSGATTHSPEDRQPSVTPPSARPSLAASSRPGPTGGPGSASRGLVATRAVVPEQDAPARRRGSRSSGGGHALCLAQAAAVEGVAQVVEGGLEVQAEVGPFVEHLVAGRVALDVSALLQLVSVAHQTPVVAVFRGLVVQAVVPQAEVVPQLVGHRLPLFRQG